MDKDKLLRHYEGELSKLRGVTVTGYNDDPKFDPTDLIIILWDEIRTANSPEALEGYFEHIMTDPDILHAVKTYTGEGA